MSEANREAFISHSKSSVSCPRTSFLTWTKSSAMFFALVSRFCWSQCRTRFRFLCSSAWFFYRLSTFHIAIVASLSRVTFSISSVIDLDIAWANASSLRRLWGLVDLMLQPLRPSSSVSIMGWWVPGHGNLPLPVVMLKLCGSNGAPKNPHLLTFFHRLFAIGLPISIISFSSGFTNHQSWFVLA